MQQHAVSEVSPAWSPEHYIWDVGNADVVGGLLLVYLHLAWHVSGSAVVAFWSCFTMSCTSVDGTGPQEIGCTASITALYWCWSWSC